MTIEPTSTRIKPNRYAQLNSSGNPNVVALKAAAVAAPSKPTGGLAVSRGPGRLVMGVDGWNKDLTHWLEHPEIADAMVFALRAWSPGRKSATVYCRLDELDRGFWDYLHEVDADRQACLADISSRWIGGFVAWLGRSDENGEPIWMPGTRSGFLTAFNVLLGELKTSATWSSKLAANVQVPTHPWPGRNRLVKPREVLDDATLVQLLIACRDEVVSTMSRVQAEWETMTTQRGHSLEAPPATAAAWRYVFSQLYRDRIPNSDWLIENNKPLFSAHRRLGLTFTELVKPLMPRARDLVPFILLLAFVTSFNPDTVRPLTFSEIDYPDEFGGSRIRFRPFKGRAGRKQARTFAKGDPVGPDAIVEFIREWTRRLRHIAEPQYKDVLFLMSTFGPDGAEKNALHATDFYGGNGSFRVGKIWFTALKGFLRDHDLPALSLAQLRPTSLDKVHEWTGGDLKAVQTAGNQRSPQVLMGHYTSDAARKRNDEALALVMQTRERLVAREGSAADPRKEPHRADRGCATPGFLCLDPFASPLPSETEGRLCQAYGMCPVCPLACVNGRDPYSAARLLQLRAAVVEAQTELLPRRWLECWAPVGKRLDEYWLPLFSDGVLTEAGRLTVPPLPSLE